MDSDEEALARGRALSSPLRIRILRICLHEPHTNKQIADRLGVSPAAALHHVRTLEQNGFLEALEPRRGRRGAREIPYRATGLSWQTPLSREHGQAQLLLDTFLQEVAEVPPGEVEMVRVGYKLDEEHVEEFRTRLHDLLTEFKDRGADPDGTPISVFIAQHPDPQSG